MEKNSVSIEKAICNMRIKYGDVFELIIVDNLAEFEGTLFRTPYYNVMKYDFAKKMIKDLDKEWEAVEVTYDGICRRLFIYVEPKTSVDEEKVSIYEHKLCELKDRITELVDENEALAKKIESMNTTYKNNESKIKELENEYVKVHYEYMSLFD